MWPHGSWTGWLIVGLVLSELGFQTVLVKGERQMEQRRSLGGMFLILMLEAVRRKSSWAVRFFRSDIVVGEMGIVMICLFIVKGKVKSAGERAV